MESLSPNIFVRDMNATIAFYNHLGFEKIMVSKYNLPAASKGQRGLAKQKFNIEVITMGRVDEVYKYLFQI